MATIGTLHEFNSSEEDWERYVEVLDNFFVANDIVNDGKKAAVLLTCVGARTYKLISDLCSPDLPSTKTYVQLSTLLKNHFIPRRSVVVSRFHFNRRNRKPMETVNEYVAELRNLAKDCDYGNQLNTMLRDRFVVGVADSSIQKKLLAEPDDLTFNRALEIARAMESASQQIQKLHEPSAAVNRVRQQQQKKKPPPKGNSTASNEKKGSKEEPDACHSCGGKHIRKNCKFRDATCYKCHGKGHIATVCGQKRRTRAHNVEATEDVNDEYNIYHVQSKDSGRCQIYLDVDGEKVLFEVDTGSATTLISEKFYKELFPRRALKPSSVRLFSYSDDPIPVLGSMCVTVTHEKKCVQQLSLLVVQGSGRSLLGRNWLRALNLDLSRVLNVDCAELDAVISEFSDLFRDELGLFKGPPAHIYLDSSCKPAFYKARSVPYAMKQGIEDYLDQAVHSGILEPVQYSDWAAPCVPILKQDKSVRLCGDYKITVNRAAKVDKYPIPTIADLYASLSGGKLFTKLDLSQAYHQIPLDDVSRGALTLNTHRGLFRPTRLPFGVASAPGIFQRIMDGLLAGLPGVCVYLDDIIITGSDMGSHLKNLKNVLTKLRDAGLRLKKSKCTFLANSVVYLGHRIDASGLHPVPEKLDAIRQFPTPSKVSELQSFLGLINHYRHFIPNLSQKL